MSKAALFFVSFAFLFAATAAHGVDPVASCQSKKLKAWAKLRSCEHKASAKVAVGGTVDPTACQSKFDAALIKAGTDCRYLSMETGTVTDLDTGLMWQKTDDAGGDTDKDNMYYWSDTGGPYGSAFTDFLARLNDCESTDGAAVTGGYAGHCDWRLPQIDELKSILLQPYPCSTNPCIDQSAFGPTNASSYYWSATSYADIPLAALGFFFGDGDVFSGYKYDIHAVRAVRSGL